ncbi:hypothetical protein [Bradyrhizobium sp.]|uniref:hypothetical protein n=1 Tax=Bradyrhizobium sp. TaxID=376 RepID=UPI0025BD70B0|nr:hypothetical protein [Bradyrhizobium sp.]
MLGHRVRASAEAAALGQPAKTLEHPFQAAQAAVRARFVLPAVWVAQAAALPPEEPGALDVAVAVVAAPREGEEAAVEAPHGEAAAAVEAPREGEEAAVGAPHEGAAVVAEVPHAEVEAAAALQRVAPGAQAGRLSVLPSAWAFRRGRVLPWPAP